MQRLGDYIKEYSARNKLDEEIPVYSVTNSNGFCRDYFGKEVASNNKRTYKIVPRNAFAYNPSRINVGSVDYQHYEDRVIVSPLYNVFTVDEKILPQYLYFYLKSPNTMKRIRTVASGSVRDNLKLSMLCEFPIQVPSINRQQNIIELLEKAQRIIDEKNNELEKLDNFIKARFVEMFDDNFGEIVELGNVCDVRDGTHDSPKYHNEGYPLVTSKNICDGKIDFSNCNLIQKEDYAKINKRSKVDVGDVLMPMIGTVGNPIIVNTDKEFAIKNVALIKFKDDSVILNTFIKTLLESDYFGRAVLSKTKGGTQKFISLGDIRKLEFNLPPIELQHRFATFVAQVDKSKFALSNELAMCNFYVRLINDSITHSRIDLRMSE